MINNEYCFILISEEGWGILNELKISNYSIIVPDANKEFPLNISGVQNIERSFVKSFSY